MTVVDQVRAAHQALRKMVPATRRAFRAEFGILSQTYTAAMQIWDSQKAEGVPLLERIAGLEQTLRAVWPQTREWKYLCTQCNDYGLVMGTCPGVTDATCGRVKPHLAHEFGTPCWCDRGRGFKDKPKPEPSDFTQAGKSKPMSRLGR